MVYIFIIDKYNSFQTLNKRKGSRMKEVKIVNASIVTQFDEVAVGTKVLNKDEFMATLKVLREKIEALEAEKAELMVEVEKLRKAAELRANALEGEVVQMREEAKSLKQLLGTAVVEKQVPPPPQKPAST